MSILRLTFLGTGTSQGVPLIGCACEVCVSGDPRDKRTRSSVFLEAGATQWVIDTGTDFRAQCLRHGVSRLDAVLYTHAHTDHILGFDDLRPFCAGGRSMPLYGSAETLEQLSRVFAFAFEPELRFPTYVNPDPRVVSGSFDLAGLQVTPLPLPHGRTTCFGYLFESAGRPLLAYLTDCKRVPEEVEERIRGVRHLVVDALRKREHPTHMSIAEALEVVERVRPGRTWFTHLCHDHLHADLEEELPVGVRVAFDGLVLEIPLD